MMLDPRLFGEGPVRDARFVVRETWAELQNFAASDPEMIVEFLHRQMNEEVEGLEMTARNLVDYPDAPWELRMEMARQCWDEARHVEAFRSCMEVRGGFVGAYPVMNFQYRILGRIESLIGRLAVQNRSFEAAGLDAIKLEVDNESNAGDLAALFDAQLADELQHVRYANKWVKKLRESMGPVSVIEVARAVAQAGEALAIIAGDAATTYPVDEGLRREAGFSDAEIEAVRRSADVT